MLRMLRVSALISKAFALFSRQKFLPQMREEPPATVRLATAIVRTAALCLTITLGACGRDSDDQQAIPLPNVRSVSTLEPLELSDVAPASGPGSVSALATWTVPPPGGVLGADPAVPAPMLEPRSPVSMPRPTSVPTSIPGAVPPLVDPEIVALQEHVSAERLRSDVRRLSGFGTRHVLSSVEDESRGIGAAREWILEEFQRTSAESTGQFTVESEDFDLDWSGRVTRQRNVIGTLTGIGDRKRLVYVTAHYDSRMEDLADGVSDAPGADDNASGTAALFELARVLGRRRWDASLRFIAFSAEEPGLYGSKYHAPRARDIGLPIEAVLNSDIIGGGPDAEGTLAADTVRIFSADPDDGPSRRLARWAAVIASRYAGLGAQVVPAADREGRHGDHQAFSDSGFAAIRIVSSVEDLRRQHSGADTADVLDNDYHAEVVRLNVALVATLALAPPPPSSAPTVSSAVDGSGNLRIDWLQTAHPGVAGHWVGVRQVGSQTYSLLLWAAAENGIDIAAADRPQGPIAVGLAASDGRGHMGLFGPEIRID